MRVLELVDFQAVGELLMPLRLSLESLDTWGSPSTGRIVSYLCVLPFFFMLLWKLAYLPRALQLS